MIKQIRKSPKRKNREKVRRGIRRGSVYIQAGLNNTIITITSKKGKVLAWSSAGASGFKGARKGTPFAAQIAATNAAQKAKEKGIREVEIIISGPGAGRESSIRAIHKLGLGIFFIRDVTPIPHNGCRPPKKRRI